MYDEDELLPLSGVAHIVFCERRAALHFLEGLWEDNLYTVEGALMHTHDEQPRVETRPGLRIVRSLRIRSLKLGLSGIADVVEFHAHDDGIRLPDCPGLWRPFPVEYKRGSLRHEISFEVQLCAQALCLEETFGIHTPEGALFYGKSQRRQAVLFDDPLRRRTAEAAERFHELMASRVTPRAEYGRKCERCSMVELCMPKAVGPRRRVAQYLARALEGEEDEP